MRTATDQPHRNPVRYDVRTTKAALVSAGNTPEGLTTATEKESTMAGPQSTHHTPLTDHAFGEHVHALTLAAGHDDHLRNTLRAAQALWDAGQHTAATRVILDAHLIETSVRTQDGRQR